MVNKTETRKITEAYHEALIPLPDVYDEGGPEVFKHLERKEAGGRNILIMPIGFVEALDHLEQEEKSVGAADALKFLKENLDKRVESPIPDLKIYRVSEGLDVCIVHDPEFANPDVPLETLEKKIKGYFGRIEAGTTLVTSKDRNHIKYNGMGFRIEEPRFLLVNSNIVYEGIIRGNEELQTRLYSSQDSSVKLVEASELLERELFINQFVKFIGAEHDVFAVVKSDLVKNTSGTRIIGFDNPRLQLLSKQEYGKKLHYGYKQGEHFMTDDILGITPLDMEQYLALQYLLINPDVSVVLIAGKHGSGKTLLGFAYAIDSTLIYDQDIRKKRGLSDEKKEAFFKQAICLKPPEVIGGKRRDIGALPGDIYMKLKSHMQPFRDAFKKTILSDDLRFEDLILHPKFETEFGPARSDFVKKKKIKGIAYFSTKNAAIEMVYSGFLGGGSLENTLFLIDEAQDFTPYEMKAIIQRMGEGSKAVILGDPTQFRNPHCNKEKNGLTFTIRSYLPKPYSGLVYLPRNYRSQASEDSEEMRVYSTS
jgi:predicted ribonuclease YlaK